jgi:hypothetical protein
MLWSWAALVGGIALWCFGMTVGYVFGLTASQPHNAEVQQPRLGELWDVTGYGRVEVSLVAPGKVEFYPVDLPRIDRTPRRALSMDRDLFVRAAVRVRAQP